MVGVPEVSSCGRDGNEKLEPGMWVPKYLNMLVGIGTRL